MRSGEIDTLLENEDGSKVVDLEPGSLRRVRALVRAEIADQMSSGGGKTFYFGDLQRVGWGECLGITMKLVQTGQYTGRVTTTFLQQMRCRRSDIAVGPDVTFQAYLIDKKGDYFDSILCGNWDRICGTHPVTLSEQFYFYQGRKLEDVADAKLYTSFIERVHGCG